MGMFKNFRRRLAGEIACMFCGTSEKPKYGIFRIEGKEPAKYISRDVQCVVCHSVWEEFFKIADVYFNKGKT